MRLRIRDTLTAKAFIRLRELFANSVVRIVNKLQAEHNLADVTLNMIIENLHHFEFKAVVDELDTDAYAAIVFWVLPTVQGKLVGSGVPSDLAENFVSGIEADVARHQFSPEGDMWYQKEIKNLPIHQLKLTRRTRDALTRAGITLVGDIVTCSPAKLVSEYGLHRQRLREIEDALESVGVSWLRSPTQ